MGDKGEAYDIKLVTPVLLTSKAVVFNLLCNRPDKQSILSALEILVHASNSLAQRSFKHNAFGHLHVVLRGCLGSDDEAQEVLFGTEDPADFPDADDDTVEGMDKRNKIRRDLVLCFESVHTWTLPELPPAGVSVSGDGGCPGLGRKAAAAELGPCQKSDEYASKICEMKGTMLRQLAEPKCFAQRALTGESLALLIPDLVSKLTELKKSGGGGSGSTAAGALLLLNPPSLMDAVNMVQAQTTAAEVCALVQAELELIVPEEEESASVVAVPPKPQSTVNAAVVRVLEKSMQTFDLRCKEKVVAG
jgi:hypothetical protein